MFSREFTCYIKRPTLYLVDIKIGHSSRRSGELGDDLGEPNRTGRYPEIIFVEIYILNSCTACGIEKSWGKEPSGHRTPFARTSDERAHLARGSFSRLSLPLPPPLFFFPGFFTTDERTCEIAGNHTWGLTLAAGPPASSPCLLGRLFSPVSSCWRATRPDPFSAPHSALLWMLMPQGQPASPWNSH